MKDNNFDGNRKVPIFKEDLEFEMFLIQVTNKLKEDLIRLRNLFRDELLFELSKIKSDEKRIYLLKTKLAEHNIYNDSNIGMNKENEIEENEVRIQVINHLLDNYIGIPKFTLKDVKTCFHLPGNDKYIKFINSTFNHMIENNLISRDTSLSSFQSIFNMSVTNKKVNWKANISQLFYFIKKLIKLPEMKFKYKWITTCNCFLLEGEELIKEQFHNQKDPKKGEKTDVIDVIFKSYL